MPVDDAFLSQLDRAMATASVSDHYVVLHPTDFAELRSGMDIVALDHQSHALGTPPRYRGVEIYVSSSIPAGQAVVVSREAVQARTQWRIDPHDRVEFMSPTRSLVGGAFTASMWLTPPQRAAVAKVELPKAPEPKTLWEHLIDEDDE